MLGILLLILLVLLLFGALPHWPYSRAWGYAPSGLLTAALLFTIVLLASDRI
jgi:hypothetical protein